MLRELLIKVARTAISDALKHTATLDETALIEQYPNFRKLAATFVTLTINGELRGCIGSLEAHRRLLDDITTNARAAALSDPRFPRLSLEEFAQMKVEVSLLSEPIEFVYQTVNDLKKRITHKDGVVLKRASNQATFLPQVWEQLPDFDTFFSHLCQKAGMDEFCLNSHPQIFLYQVQKFQE